MTAEGRLRRLQHLPPTDRRFLLGALALVALTRVALWVAPFRSVRRLAGRLFRAGHSSSLAGDVERIRWAVGHASRVVPGTSCLAEALVAEMLLRVTGHPSVLRFGMARDDEGRPEAHAWVESGDRVVVGGRELERYEVFRSAADAR